MTYSTTLTSKGQMTLPVDFRKKLNLKPGEKVLVEMRGNKVIIQKDNWRDNLKKVQKENQLLNNRLLTDSRLDEVINSSAEEAASQRYRRSLES